MQIAFDLDYVDPVTGSNVPWAQASPALLRDITAAPWKIVDVETTELNPASRPISFTGRELRRGIDPTPRLRVVSLLFPLPQSRGTSLVAFDLDLLRAQERVAVCDAALTHHVLGHNAGFDVGWLRVLSKVEPARVLDSMLLARVFYPQQPLKLAALANDESAPREHREAAIRSFEQGRSGWSLADLALTVLGELVPKDLQGPRNWCEPFLTQAHYDYATGDVRLVYDLLLKWLALAHGADVLAAYDQRAAGSKVLKLLEPQVLDVLRMREKGMPWSVEEADKYVLEQQNKVRAQAAQLIEIEPPLASHAEALASFDEGVNEELKKALGAAFERRGLSLETTEKTDQPRIGEKDLRRAKAAITPHAKPLFDAWTGLCRAKKAGQMAEEFSGFARRSSDRRIHSNIGHGPVTNRLASTDPNVQQAPRDQGFRNAVKAAPGHKIIACDHSALDMRVAAALAIRAQRQIFQCLKGQRAAPRDVKRIIECAYQARISLEEARRLEHEALAAWADWRTQRAEHESDARSRERYWERWRALSRAALLMRFQRCLIDVRRRAESAGTPEWGSLRDAFSIAGMDIHTWTALSMAGEDPLALFAGKPNEVVVEELKKQKKRLGDRRQGGKVGNLSLTYAMKELGFQESAAKVHNIHWTLAEAQDVRTKWLATYVEVDLWHCWTELHAQGTVYVPDPDRGNRFTRKPVFASYTLADRLIYAFGVNAALAYEDQSTGADLLGLAMDRFNREYPELARCIVNQVHDEIVFEVPAHCVETYTPLIASVMVSCAEIFLSPYGVRAECSPAVGDVWLKD